MWLNRCLQLRGYLDCNRRNNNARRSIHSVRHGHWKLYGNLNSIGLYEHFRSCDDCGHRGATDHHKDFCCGDACHDQFQPNGNMRGNRHRHWRLQPRRYMDCNRWDNNASRSLHSIRNRNRNLHCLFDASGLYKRIRSRNDRGHERGAHRHWDHRRYDACFNHHRSNGALRCNS